MRQAWHTAVLALQGFAGEMPDLAALLSTAKPKTPQTADELQGAIVAWLGPPPQKTGD